MEDKIKDYLQVLEKMAEETSHMITDGTSLAQRFYWPDDLIIGKKVVVIPISVLRKIIGEK